MDSRRLEVLGFTWFQVRARRRMGAVPMAEMMAVREEKLLRLRHFWDDD
jgi:hypothetical protein